MRYGGPSSIVARWLPNSISSLQKKNLHGRINMSHITLKGSKFSTRFHVPATENTKRLLEPTLKK